MSTKDRQAFKEFTLRFSMTCKKRMTLAGFDMVEIQGFILKKERERENYMRDEKKKKRKWG